MPEQQPAIKGFTSWADLHKAMLDDLASGAWRTLASYSLGGRTFAYRSIKDFRELLDFVKTQADAETGVRPFRRRTYGRQGGRGW